MGYYGVILCHYTISIFSSAFVVNTQKININRIALLMTNNGFISMFHCIMTQIVLVS